MKKDAKTSFPAMAVSHWWKLRSQFKRHIPGAVTKSYLSSVLNVKESTARQCVLPELRALGFIDEHGRVSRPLVERWRQDSHYPLVCSEMKHSVYPDELTLDVSSPLKDRKAVTRWFSEATGSGTSRVKKMVSFYTLLCAADPSQGTIAHERKHVENLEDKDPVQEKTYGGGKREWTMPGKRRAGTRKEEKASEPKAPAKKREPAEHPDAPGQRAEESARRKKSAKESQKTSPQFASVSVSRSDPPVTEGRGLNVNVQVHLSADVSPSQIDQIFKSMADHLLRMQTSQEETFSRPTE